MFNKLPFVEKDFHHIFIALYIADLLIKLVCVWLLLYIWGSVVILFGYLNMCYS
jgi:hypothetical protein